MTNEENIKRLEEAIEKLKIKAEERCYQICWNKRGERYICARCNVPECYDIAIESIEKQIPKKPFKISNDIYHCAVCSAPVRLGSVWDDNFCNACGQAIDWGDVE